MILGHNAEHTVSMSRLPILVLECSKGRHLETRPCQTGLKFGLFEGVNIDKIGPENFMGESFQDSLPGSSGVMRKHSRTLCPG